MKEGAAFLNMSQTLWEGPGMYHQDRTSPLLKSGLGRYRVTRERWIKEPFRELSHTRDRQSQGDK